MSLKSSPSLQTELEDLFDIRYAQKRNDKILTKEAMEAQRDIRLITHMFRDGIPDITMPINDHESIKWDSDNKRLLLIGPEGAQNLEGAPKLIMVHVRPHLSMLVKQAKEFYKN